MFSDKMLKVLYKRDKFRPASTREACRCEAGVAQIVMPYTYILKSCNHKKLYVGSTDNLDHRLKQHNSGLSYYTKKYLPWLIIYTEEYKNIKEARKRERYFKSAAGRRFIKKNIIPVKFFLQKDSGLGFWYFLKIVAQKGFMPEKEKNIGSQGLVKKS